MNWFKNKHNIIFFFFLLSVLTFFPVFTKVNSGYIRFISGDGVGYYAYLPATFIYSDTQYEFKWLNKAYYQNYDYDSFGEKNKDFFVPYKNRTINKYYPGLSFLWIPFFAGSHLAAKILHYPADGFSPPYQAGIALASLCYVLLGLVFLRKLLQKLFQNKTGALVITITLFWGTYLSIYMFCNPSYSHVYSFTFITMFIYYAHSFFNSGARRWQTLFWCLFCFTAVIFIRPLNVFILLALPAFIPAGYFKTHLKNGRLKISSSVPLLLMLILVIYQFGILYIQTGTIIPYTYTNERFNFSHPKMFFVLFGYGSGMLVYMPLLSLSLFGIFCLPALRQRILLPLTFFLIVYLYSTWWYWPATARSLIDFYVLIAVLLGALYRRFESFNKIKISLALLLFVMAGYSQLKFMQGSNGILDANYTDADLFWRNFFRIQNTNIYPVPPASIIKQQQHTEDFETGSYQGNRSSEKKYAGNYSAVLNDHTEYTRVFEYRIPAFFMEKGIRRIKASFKGYFSKDISNVHVTIAIYDKGHHPIRTVPFYMGTNTMRYNVWDAYEFGIEVTDEEMINRGADHVCIYLWNPGFKNELFMDDMKTEFLLTGEYYETFSSFFKKIVS